MSPSISQTKTLTCPYCRKTFRAEIWLVVDAEEHPELLEKVKRDMLHEIPCPKCGFHKRVRAPLLLFLPPDSEAGVKAVFSPTDPMRIEREWERTRQLLNQLDPSLGEVWQEELLARRLPIVLSSSLSTFICEGTVEAPFLALVERTRLSLEMQVLEHVIPHILPELGKLLEEVLRSGVEIRSVEDAKQVLEQHPEFQEKLEQAVRQIPPPTDLKGKF